MARTARPPGPASVEAADGLSCVVAVCQGHRCRALLAGQEPPGLAALRQAVAGSRLGVLVTTGCAGRCADGPVVVVGVGRHAGGRLQVATQAALGPVGPAHVRLLAEHLRSGPGPLPPLLGEVRLRAGARR